MTLPDERYRAVIQTRDFLRKLLDPKEAPRIPKRIREEASRCLRHYPWDSYMQEVAVTNPNIFKERK